MGGKTGGAKKAVKLVENKVGLTLERLGGGKRKVIKIRTESPELILARNSYKGAEMSHNLETQRYKEASQRELALLDRSKKWKNPNSTRNQARLNAASGLTREAENRAITASQKARQSKEALNNVKKLVTSDALRLVRNKGIKRLSTVGALGALGLGTYGAFSGSPASTNAAEETPLQYRYDPNNGWLEYNQETGQYENLLLGFGVDRFGNTNYYDGQNWLTPDLYILGSNGYIYDKQTGLYIGTADDTMDAHSSGYDNVFDYRAAKAGYNSPEAVKQLQTQLGITADGKWGQLTLDAFNRAAYNWALQYDPNSLFSIYLRKMLYGY